MTELDPLAGGPSPAELAPPDPEATQARVGNIAIGQDQLIDPSVTLATVDAMLTQPDEQGRMLPTIEFDGTDTEELGSRVKSVTDRVRTPDGGVVGVSQVLIDADGKTEFFTQVTALEQGKGYGPAIYLKAIKRALEQNHDFRTDPASQTPEAVAMWEKFADEGLASVVEPFTPMEDGSGRSRGYYVINGNDKPKTLPEEKEKLTVEF